MSRLRQQEKGGVFLSQSSCMLFPSRFPSPSHPRMPPSHNPQEHPDDPAPIDWALVDFVLKGVLLILGILYYCLNRRCAKLFAEEVLDHREEHELHREHLLPHWSPYYSADLLSNISDAFDIPPDRGLPPGLKEPSSPLPLPSPQPVCSKPSPSRTCSPTPPSLDCSLLRELSTPPPGSDPIHPVPQICIPDYDGRRGPCFDIGLLRGVADILFTPSAPSPPPPRPRPPRDPFPNATEVCPCEAFL